MLLSCACVEKCLRPCVLVHAMLSQPHAPCACALPCVPVRSDETVEITAGAVTAGAPWASLAAVRVVCFKCDAEEGARNLVSSSPLACLCDRDCGCVRVQGVLKSEEDLRYIRK